MLVFMDCADHFPLDLPFLFRNRIVSCLLSSKGEGVGRAAHYG